MKQFKIAILAVLATTVLAVWPTYLRAAEKEDDRHKVKAGKLNNDVELDAVLESARMEPLQLVPRVWTDLSVLESVPHGSKVKKGDVVLRLDPEKINEQLTDLRRAAPGEKLTLELAEAELSNSEKAAPLKLEAARRSKIRANEEYDYFVETGREEREKAAQWRVRNSEQNLRNETEELTQLEKMYKADDLTEETEEIILERQKNAVESAKYYLENAKLFQTRELKTLIPRAHEDLKNSKLETDLALALAEQTHQQQLEQKRLNVEKQRRDRQKNQKKLTELQEDLEMMVVTAPMDGVVYYGACEGGKWVTAAPVAKKLIPGGKIASREIFMTLVDPSQMRLLAVVPEEKLSKVSTGMKGQASPVAAPDTKLPVRVEELGWVPLPTGGFACTLMAERREERLVPGMNCKIKLHRSEAEEKVLVPKSAVFGEDENRYVWVCKDEDKPEQQKVRVGEADDKMIQVLEGLSVGDEIFLKKPE